VPLAASVVTGAVVSWPPRSASFITFFAIEFFAFHRATLPGVCVIYGGFFTPEWGELSGNSPSQLVVERAVNAGSRTGGKYFFGIVPLNAFSPFRWKPTR